MIYGTLAGSKSYHADRGNTAWAAADDTALNEALLRASEYVDYNFGSSFPGCKAGDRDQVRYWPRYDAYDRHGDYIPGDVIPFEVEWATYEAALRELADPGSLHPDFTPGTQIKSARVDGAVSVEYVSPVGVASIKPILTIVGGILAPVLTANGSGLAGRSNRQ